MDHARLRTGSITEAVDLVCPRRSFWPHKIYNAVFLIDADGEIVGHHRKINTHVESWASPGDLMQPASCHGIKVGVLICADAYTAAIAQTLRSKGAQLLVSSAAWAPGLNGPEGEWEERTVETRLPLIVCNRTGTEGTLTFNGAAKVSSKVGRVMPIKAGNANPRSAASPINLTSLTKSPLASGSLDPRPTTIIAVRSRFAGWLSHSRSIAASTIAGWMPKDSIAAPLGLHQGLLRTLEYRLNETVSGISQLPCDNCQYRVPMAAVVNNVGGLKAMLWSIRHLNTHSQAMPHLQAHRSMRKHVLVCGNADCASRGSISLIGTLRRLVKRAGQEQGIRITKAGCMGRCGEGPTVAIYPDGIWYRAVTAADASELVEEHLLNDRLVGPLIDAIMQ